MTMNLLANSIRENLSIVIDLAPCPKSEYRSSSIGPPIAEATSTASFECDWRQAHLP